MPSEIGKVLLLFGNISIRSLSLVSRFGLLVYLAKYFSLADVGAYGLLTAVILITVPLSDLGFGSYVSRELSGAEPKHQLPLLFANTTALLIFTPIAITIILFLQYHHILSIINSLTFYIILILEICCNMFFMALLAVQRPLIANTVVFVRSGLWIFPVIIIGILYPSSRSLDVILFAWLLGALSALLGSAYFFFHLRVHFKPALEATLPKFKHGIGISLNLWLATASGILGQYADRFVLERMLGLDFVGIVTIFWTMANVVQILTSTSVTFIFQPRLVIAYNDRDKPAFRAQLRRALLEAGVFAGALSILLVYVFPNIMASMSHTASLLNYAYLFPFVMLASFLRIMSDCIYVALYAVRYDKGLWIPNTFTLVFSVILNFTLIPIVGFSAIVWVFNLVTLATFIMRIIFLELRVRKSWIES